VLYTVEREKSSAIVDIHFRVTYIVVAQHIAFSIFGPWRSFNEAVVRLGRPIAAYQIVSLLAGWARRELFIGFISGLW
jgi:hypothetical protein